MKSSIYLRKDKVGQVGHFGQRGQYAQNWTLWTNLDLVDKIRQFGQNRKIRQIGQNDNFRQNVGTKLNNLDQIDLSLLSESKLRITTDM